jgi:hypothetical protein
VTPNRLRLTALALLTLAVLSGCSATPDPDPTPTPAFASEEEAFAAAEELYLEYSEAVNARIAGKAEPNPQDFLIGHALEADIDAGRYFEEHGLQISGTSAVRSFTGVRVEGAGRDVTITVIVCLDASGIRAIDAHGVDVTPADRGDTVAQMVEFVGTRTELWIADEKSESADQC